MAQKTVRQIMEDMPAAFRPERARGVNTVIQFRLTGEGGGDWCATIRDGTCTVAEGVSAVPKATMTMAASDYLALGEGKLSGMQALLTGRIKTSGDLSLLKRMENWFVR